MNVIASQMEQSVHWTHVIQKLVNAIVNHRLRVAFVMNVKMEHSIWLVAICLVVKIVDAISVARYMAIVIKKRVNANVILVLRAEHVPKQ